MIWSASKLMMNLSVLFMNTIAPHIYTFPLKYYLLYVSARSEGVEIYNCDNKLSILGVSFTGIVKNACVLSNRCVITYAELLQICHLKYMYTIHVLCNWYLQPPPCFWDRGIIKILTFPSAKLVCMPCTKGTF